MAIEQATELEVPVTIQGSKCVEGKEQRELFTETTKTTIVFESGAVLSLKAKVQPGQCVFLKNEQSGREMLCKVMESRSGGEVFYTDLEFTARDPEFWDVKAAPTPSAPAPNSIGKSDPQKSAEEFAAPRVSAAPAESDKPFTGEIPVTATTAAASPLVAAPPVPLPPLELVPAHEQAATLSGTPPVTASETSSEIRPETQQETPPDWDEAREQELVAALIAMEGGNTSKRDLAKKETKGSVTASASDGTAQQAGASPDAKSPDAGSEVTGSAARWWRRWRPPSLAAAAKNPMTIGIAASFVLVAVLGIAWHAKGGSSAHSKQAIASASAGPAAPAAATATSSSQVAPQTSPSPATGEPSQTPASATASAAAPGTAPAAATPSVAADSRGATTVENSSASVISSGKTASNKTTEAPLVSDQGSPRQAKTRRQSAPQSGEIVPAKVVSQPPPLMPDWAKGLDTDGIVKLDALIDEKGNLAGAKAISGPRMLQGAAERAVALWVFEPALADGKPVATHMTLTVEFQRSQPAASSE